MPEPHNPERTPDGEGQHFKSSVPDLRPNLGVHRSGTGNPDQGLVTHFENNELGRDADELYKDHRSASSELRYRVETAEIDKEILTDLEITIRELRTAFNHAKPENLMERAVLEEAIKVIEARRDRRASQRQEEDALANTAEISYLENEMRSRTHYHNNEEAIKNQAVNDYRHAQATDPIRYSEPLNYPPYTDETGEPPASSEAHGQG